MKLIYNLNPSSIRLLTEVFLLQSLSPSSNWSFVNRLIVRLHETNDARSFDDWRKINRLPHVHSAFNIVYPVEKHVKKYSKQKKKETEYDLKYYTTRSVYRYEDTQGIEYPSIEIASKNIMDRNQFLDTYELDEITQKSISECIEKLVPATEKYDNKLVRFLVSNIIIALYNPEELDRMGHFEQIRKYDKNIIYYALSSLAYSAKVLENLLCNNRTEIREQKNEYLSSTVRRVNSDTPLVN